MQPPPPPPVVPLGQAIGAHAPYVVTAAPEVDMDMDVERDPAPYGQQPWQQQEQYQQHQQHQQWQQHPQQEQYQQQDLAPGGAFPPQAPPPPAPYTPMPPLPPGEQASHRRISIRARHQAPMVMAQHPWRAARRCSCLRCAAALQASRSRRRPRGPLRPQGPRPRLLRRPRSSSKLACQPLTSQG
jgi:hypothetical protein